MRQSRVLKKLRQNKPVLVGSPTPYPSAKICELIGKVGYDCIWIDHEHQDFNDSDIWNMSLACRATDIDAMVRIRKAGYFSYFRAIESGANGIMVPHCMSREEAEWAVRNTKFAPIGLRGMDGIEAHTDHSLQPMKEFMTQSNEETFIVVQIEDKEAVEKIDDIASVNGIDILLVGPADLSQSLGRPLDFDNPELQQVIDKVADAAKRHGKHWGITIDNAESAEKFLEKGARFLCWGAAVILLAKGFSGIKREFDSVSKLLR
ncbi:hypothetical protein KKC91_01330 [bacterium]|nr:hypothetical protein [bacterium]